MNKLSSDTFICIASGPSLTQEDIILASKTEYPVIAVNNAGFDVGSGVIIYSSDMAWWDIYYHRASKKSVQLWSSNINAVNHYGLNMHSGIKGEFNSGQQAIHLATTLGARTVILLGYDCSLRHGLHFHGAHKYGLSNPTSGSLLAWKRQFSKLTEILPDTEIINCSRYTELTCFKRSSFDSFI